MPKEPKFRFAGQFNAREKQALDRLCIAKRPDGVNCMTGVLRDCIEYSYWALLRKYNGMDTDPKPLPEIEKEKKHGR